MWVRDGREGVDRDMRPLQFVSIHIRIHTHTPKTKVVFGAIQKGKHVVTANKALLAKHLPEITALLKEHPEVKFAYEAAVCGGIPIIHTLQNDYLGDQVSQVGAWGMGEWMGGWIGGWEFAYGGGGLI